MFKLFELCYLYKDIMELPDKIFLESLKNNFPVDGVWPSQQDDWLLDILNELIQTYNLQ